MFRLLVTAGLLAAALASPATAAETAPLAAPRLLAPAEGAEAACANPVFSWQPVAEAASYSVEVCLDAGCSAVVERAERVVETAWRPQALPAGRLFWRVTAHSRPGDDGARSAARQLAVVNDRTDLQPPAGAVTLSGPQVRVGETLFGAPGVRIDGVATDPESGLASWRPVVNGLAVAVAGPWTAGRHEVGGVAMDRCGNQGPLAPLVFTVDATPPSLTWEVVAYNGFEGRGRKARQARKAPLSWSGGAQWLPLAAGEEVRIASDNPQVLFHARGARFLADGRAVVLGDGDMLRIRSADDESRVDHLRFLLRQDGGGKSVLDITTEDLVGNARKVTWELRLP